MRIFKSVLLLIALAWSVNVVAAETVKKATLYKDPYCGCCEEYAKYLRENGFKVMVVVEDDMPVIKRKHKVTRAYESCHTTVVDGYVVEGHVPVAAIKKLLAERPQIKGISVPGMPLGSPGMNGEKTEPLAVYEIAGDEKKVYFTE